MNRPLVKSLGADWVNVLFGAWVIASPFVLGFAGNLPIRWDNVAVGGTVVLLAFAAGRMSAVRGLMVLLGGWLLTSPFYFGYTMAIVSWNNIVMGILIIIGTVLAESMRPVDSERLKAEA
jgi:hypothetical protein